MLSLARNGAPRGLENRTMPEGHLIHRLARLHGAWLGGRVFQVDSPQGRFVDGAQVLDGGRLAGVDALGKHLFYRFEGGVTLHVHLGLFGKIRTFRGTFLARETACRLRMRSAGVELHLIGATTCELLSPEGEAALRARLGPDPLEPHADPERFVRALARRKTAVGVALMDQSVVSGVGNIYRAEALFLSGLSPWTPSHSLSRATVEQLWKSLTALLSAGERNGRIHTVPRAHPPGRTLRGERTYVYGRAGERCLRCETSIQKKPMATRTVYWCATCQPLCGDAPGPL